MGLESDYGAVVDRGASSLQRGDLAQEQADAEEGPEFLCAPSHSVGSF